MRDNIPWETGAALLADKFSPTPPTCTLRQAIECFESLPEAGKAIAIITCDVLVIGKETLNRDDIEYLAALL